MIKIIRKYLTKSLSYFSILLLFVLVSSVSWQVFSRYILNTPSTNTDEIARFTMIWLALAGAALCVGKQKHLAIDLFITNLEGVKKRIMNIYINLFIMLFAFSIMINGGFNLISTVYSSGQVSPALQLNVAYVYAILPISGFICLFYSSTSISDDIKEILSARKHKKETETYLKKGL